MIVAIYDVDQETGTESHVWSGDLEEILKVDEGLSEEQVAELRGLSEGSSVMIGGGAAALHRVTCARD